MLCPLIYVSLDLCMTTFLVHFNQIKVVCLNQVSRFSSSVMCQACPPGEVSSLSALVKSVGCPLQSSLKIVRFSQVSRFSASFKFQGCSLYSVDLIHFSQSVNLVRFSQVSSLSTSVKCRACPLQLSVKLVRFNQVSSLSAVRFSQVSGLSASVRY